MDYHLLAEELIELHRRLLSFPVNRMLADLAKGELFVLNYLMVHQDPVHPKELSKQMMVSTARVAALLNRMEEEGLIVRLPDSRDNRQTIITPTQFGIQFVQEHRTELVDVMAKALELLGPEDAQNYLRIQKKILQNLTPPV